MVLIVNTKHTNYDYFYIWYEFISMKPIQRNIVLVLGKRFYFIFPIPF